MPLVLGHPGLDLGQFPDLVAQRGGILPRQLPVTAPTGRRLEGDDVVALLGGEERALVPGVAGLTAPEPGGPGLAPGRLGVGVFATGR
jgi:hypothetical protein